MIRQKPESKTLKFSFFPPFSWLCMLRHWNDQGRQTNSFRNEKRETFQNRVKVELVREEVQKGYSQILTACYYSQVANKEHVESLIACMSHWSCGFFFSFR